MKTFRYALISLFLVLLTACGQQDGDAAATAGQPAPATAAAPAAERPKPQAGVHYVEIDDAQPYLPLDGQIEVVEVFGYTCPACASFEPMISAWKERQPDDVRVTRLAAPFGGPWMPFAKAFFAAEAQGLVDDTHNAMFNAIHRERSLPAQGVGTDALADFYASHGADARQFSQAMESFAVSGQLRRAEQFVNRTGVDSTPTLIVNGKYRVVSGQDFQDLLHVVDHLVERERAAGADEAPPAAPSDQQAGDQPAG